KTRIVIRVLLALLALLTLVCAGLGSFVYPANYNFIWQDVGVEYAPVAALGLRNILIVVMAVLALIWLALETWCDWKMSKHDPSAESSPASTPLAPTPGADTEDAVPASVASPSAANPSTATPSTPDTDTASTSEASARDASAHPDTASRPKASPQAISAESSQSSPQYIAIPGSHLLGGVMQGSNLLDSVMSNRVEKSTRRNQEAVRYRRGEIDARLVAIAGLGYQP